MFYVYVLQSSADQKMYTGYTYNLKERLISHNAKRSSATRNRGPLRVIYFEGCLNKKDALQREKYLKTAWGKRYIKNRLKNYFYGHSEIPTDLTWPREM